MVARQATAGHDTVDMGVTLQGLAPSTQNGQEADLGPQVLRIGRDFQQGLGAGFEQEFEENFLVLPHPQDQLVGDAEDQMIVGRGQQFPLTCR
jgi:hypothetical protein